MENCVPTCRNVPGITAAASAMCDQVCACAADESEKFITVEEIGMIIMADKVGMASDEQKAKMQRLKDVSLACAQKLAR